MFKQQMTKQELISKLSTLGMVEDVDYEIYARGNEYEVSFTVEASSVELPEELSAHKPSPNELDKMMRKGNTEKNSTNGAEFDYALNEYCNKKFNNDPRVIELRKNDSKYETIEELQVAREKRQALYNEIVLNDSQIAEWIKILDEMD